MNAATRSIVVLTCVCFCAAGLIATSREPSLKKYGTSDFLLGFGLGNNYQFAASDLDNLNVGELEEMIRADAFSRFPRVRVEFGLLKFERGTLTIPVVISGPNQQVQAFLYKLVPDKASWKITGAQRLWFVSPSQIVRGLRV